MPQLFTCHTNIDNICTLTARSLLIIYGTMRVRNQKTTINNKVKATEEIFLHDPAK